MARIDIDIDDLEAFRDRVASINVEEVMKEALTEMALRALAKTKKRTPVGEYDDGRVGGTLRRSWYISEIKKEGNNFVMELYNDAKNDSGEFYAPYVEYGHRKRGSSGWINGHFMMTISIDEVKRTEPKIMERKIAEAMARMFKGDV